MGLPFMQWCSIESLPSGSSWSDRALPQPDGTFIAQRILDVRHLLRVDYREVADERMVITVCSARNDRRALSSLFPDAWSSSSTVSWASEET